MLTMFLFTSQSKNQAITSTGFSKFYFTLHWSYSLSYKGKFSHFGRKTPPATQNWSTGHRSPYLRASCSDAYASAAGRCISRSPPPNHPEAQRKKSGGDVARAPRLERHWLTEFPSRPRTLFPPGQYCVCNAGKRVGRQGGGWIFTSAATEKCRW